MSSHRLGRVVGVPGERRREVQNAGEPRMQNSQAFDPLLPPCHRHSILRIAAFCLASLT